jgi:hypothetical protein
MIREFGLDTVRKLNIFWQKQNPALVMMEVSKTSHNHCEQCSFLLRKQQQKLILRLERFGQRFGEGSDTECTI